MKRPTIADIAEAAGVSKGAVSYALNGKAGVSERTRERIVEIAGRMGWHPSSAARALSDGRAGAVGVVVDRPARALGVEPFFMQMISGVQAGLAASGTALLLQVTEDAAAEEDAYRRWWGERRVDGVLLVDLREDDPRPGLLGELGLPAVVVGHAAAGTPAPSVWIDEGAAVRETLAYLAAMGHRGIARVAGPAHFVHTRERGEVFDAAAAELGLEGGVRRVHCDYSGEDGARATRRLLSGSRPPTAIVYDNDVMAVAALGVAQEMGVSVPGELSLVAWDDSVLCRLVHPSLTAVSRRVPEYGAKAAAALLALVGGEDVADVVLEPPVLVPRGSTAPARR